MSKRFTDTEKWKNPWYRKLPSALRELWNYILDMCDHAGIWRTDFELAAMIIGVDSFTPEQAIQAYGERIVVIDHDKWFIPSFIIFQYGFLQENEGKKLSNVKQSVIRVLNQNGINHVTLTLQKEIPTLQKISGTTKDKDKDKVKDKEQDKDSYSNENFQNFKSPVFDSTLLSALVSVWGETLKHFKINLDPKLDETALARYAMREEMGFEKVRLALIGMRYEEPTATFNPAKNVRLTRLSKPELFEKFVKLGAQDQGAVTESGSDYSFLAEEGGA